jgi:outer membrane protein OmpA-like peptidoglycan-associated protein
MPRLLLRVGVFGWLAVLVLSSNATAETQKRFPSAELAFPSSTLASASSGVSFGAAELGFPSRNDIRETAQELRIELAADVLFDFDKADIRPEAAAALGEAAELIRQKSRGPVRVQGHTDSRGGDAYNQKLSERRAAAVALWLRTRGGLTTKQFQTSGLGSLQPAVPNQKPDGSDDPEGRQKNRRVTLTIQK